MCTKIVRKHNRKDSVNYSKSSVPKIIASWLLMNSTFTELYFDYRTGQSRENDRLNPNKRRKITQKNKLILESKSSIQF